MFRQVKVDRTKVASMKKSAEIPKQRHQAKTLAPTRRGDV